MSSVLLASTSLRLLREQLIAADPRGAPGVLLAAGRETGALLVEQFQVRLAHRTGLEEPGLLDARWLGPLLSEFLAETGWGTASLVELGDEAILLDAPEWAEAQPSHATEPGCHFSVGMLTALLSAIAGAPVRVVEVECRTAGAAACRFVVGSDDLMTVLRDLVLAGGDWRTAITAAHPA
jgi:predicted hydrocarbon binding protein